MIVLLQLLYLARVTVTSSSMKGYLDPVEVAQVVLKDGISICAFANRLCLPAQSQKHGGDDRKQRVTLGEMDRAIEGLQPISWTSICSSAGGTR